MGHPDYASLGQHGMPPPPPQEQDYRQHQPMYGAPVQSDPAYGQQPQMFDNMYGYGHMPPQQVSPIPPTLPIRHATNFLPFPPFCTVCCSLVN
jgi:hypothetical protein